MNSPQQYVRWFTENGIDDVSLVDPKNVDLLLVDDDSEFREIAARRFDRTGYRVRQAADGEEALALAERRQFDVAVVDMRMPKMSGLEFLERPRATVSSDSWLSWSFCLMWSGTHLPRLLWQAQCQIHSNHEMLC